jgi:hypothetical protein
VWQRVTDVADQLDLLRQRLSYGSPQGITNADGEIELRFVFNRNELEAAFRDSHVFFREILEIDPDLRDLILDTNEQHLSQAVSILFGLMAQNSVNGQLRWRACWSDGDIKYIKVLVDAPVGHGVDPNFCTIDFHIPQRKSKPFCLMQIGAPTFEPVLQFHHLDPDIELDMFPFFPESVKEDPRPFTPNQIEYTAPDSWVFPRSGVVFAWRHTGEQA